MPQIALPNRVAVPVRGETLLTALPAAKLVHFEALLSGALRDAFNRLVAVPAEELSQLFQRKPVSSIRGSSGLVGRPAAGLAL